MAEGLDEIVQKILLEGDVQVINQLGELGKAGFETFQQMAEAAEKGAGGLELFGTSLALVTTALVGAAGAVGAFVEAQAEAIQQSNLLAKSFGATTAQISGLEAAFASAGVSTNAFEQFAQRLTSTVARQWPAIAESIRLSSEQQDQAQERVVASTLRVQDAQQNLGLVNDQTSSKLINSSLSVRSAIQQLGENADKTYQQMVHDQQNAASAGLSLEAAQQRLATLEGRPPSEADKKNLEIAEAKLAVDKAQQAVSDAALQQQQHEQEAALKRQQAEQAVADAQLKHEAAINEAATARQKAELAVKEAITAREEAEDRAQQAALKSIPAISSAIQGMIDGNKQAANAIDITQVSVQNLERGLIAAASAANGGGLPTGLQTLTQLSRLLSSEQGKLISESQRLALVMQLGQQRMQQTGASASELLNVLSRGPGIFTQFNDAANTAFSNTTEAAHNVEHFKDAFEQLSYTIQLVNRDLAASSLPVFTQALDAIRESLTSSDGLLHGFVEGIKALGTAIGGLISGAQALFAAIDSAFNLEKGRTFQLLIVTIIALVGAFASAWLAIPAIIAGVVTAVGFLAEAWNKVKPAVQSAWEAITNTAAYKGLAAIASIIGDIISKLIEAGSWAAKAFAGALFQQAVDIIKGIGSAISLVVSGFEALTSAIDRAFDLTPGTAFKAILASAVVLVGAFASAWLAVPAIIAVVVTTIGYISDNWDKVKEAAANAWKAITDSSIYKFLDGVVERIKSVYDWFSKLPARLFGSGGDGQATPASSGGDQGGGDNTLKAATGGEIHGRGTKTSDSIPARLSDGEFVHQAAAVDYWGTDFMHAINRMEWPGFAAGGSPSPMSRPGSASGGPIPATSTFNINLEGKSFNGFRGPKDVVDSLQAHAVSKQTASAGRKPSWVG